MNSLFHTDFSISDSLKSVRKSVLIYETIILHPQVHPLQNVLMIVQKKNLLSVL